MAAAKTKTSVDRKLLTVQELAEFWGVSKAWVYRNLSIIPGAVRLPNSQIRFDPHDIERFLLSKKQIIS